MNVLGFFNFVGMELEKTGLFASYEKCLAISKYYPEAKTAFSWYKYRGGSICGMEFTVGETHYYSIYENDRFRLGMNFFAIRFTDEIIPAFTLQDLMMLGEFGIASGLKSPDEMAEIIIELSTTSE